MNNTIGEENYRWFLLFLTIHVVMCAYGSIVCMLLFRGEIKEKKLLELVFFDRSTGEEFESSWFVVSQYLFAQRTPECSVMIIMGVMAIALGMFLGYHMYLTSTNQTTNEQGKWQDIKKWFKAEKKKYDNAVKMGKVHPNKDDTKITEAPVIEDGDVTCTGGVSSVKETQQIESEDYFDPGPVPRNPHDRGFIENWKEVLFPLSLRKNAMQLGGYSRKKSDSGGSGSKRTNPVASDKSKSN